MAQEVKSDITWTVKTFTELSLMELHDLLRLRLDIFVVEQDCPYSEIDGRDPECIHVLGSDKEAGMIATARIAPAGIIYEDWSIGRVVVRQDFRSKNIGRVLMRKAIDHCRSKGAQRIKIAAQLYLKKFYSDMGFESYGEIYPWDGIDHIDMKLNLT